MSRGPNGRVTNDPVEIRQVVIDVLELLRPVAPPGVEMRTGAVAGDGCNPRILRDRGVSSADLFFAVSNDDAANMLAALTARRSRAAASDVEASRSVRPCGSATFEPGMES